MKINFLKNTLTIKPQKFKKIEETDITSIKKANQVFSDCYLLASMHALTQSRFGQKMLFKNIRKLQTEVPITRITKTTPQITLPPTKITTYSFKFNDVYGEKEIYPITTNDYAKYFQIYSKQKNPLICSLEIAITKLVKKHFFKKPLISRMNFPFLYKNFEFNLPSNFFKTFTGIKPISIGEKSLNMTLKPYKKEVLSIFKKMSENPNKYSFVAGTGINIKGKGWHCFVVIDCDYINKKIILQNKRSQAFITLTFDEAIKKLKFLTGYFDPKIKTYK